MNTRWIPAAGAAAYLGAHAALGGLRADHGWLAAGGLIVAYGGERLRPLGRFLLPLLIMAAVYDAQRYWADALRGPVRVAEPRAWELAWFGVADSARVLTPAEWWQRHPHPALDLILGAAYLLFLPAFLAAAAWWRFVWARREPAAGPRADRIRRAEGVMWAMLWLNLAGYVTYLVYPAAPPWYVERYGLGPAVLTAAPEAAGAARFDALLGVTWFADFYGRSANIFGAIPSLHCGQTFLAAYFAWRFRSLRVAVTLFFAAILLGSVYLNHHYLVDGLVGVIYALVVARVVERAPGRTRAPPDAVP